jgi:menaquinone-dependent protoporphyrinogen IX oxidase
VTVKRVLFVYASADGSPAEIASCIAQHLRDRGHYVSDRSADAARSLDGVDAVVLASAVHNRQ